MLKIRGNRNLVRGHSGPEGRLAGRKTGRDRGPARRKRRRQEHDHQDDHGHLETGKGQNRVPGPGYHRNGGRGHREDRDRLRSGGTAHLPGPHRPGQPDAGRDAAEASIPRRKSTRTSTASSGSSRSWRSSRDRLGWQLSGGQQQMLAIGRGLMSRLEDPAAGRALAGPGAGLVQEVFRVIKEINKAGTTILLVEQNARMALLIANRGFVLETGRMMLTDTAANLLANEEMKAHYLGGHAHIKEARQRRRDDKAGA